MWEDCRDEDSPLLRMEPVCVNTVEEEGKIIFAGFSADSSAVMR